MKTRHFLALAAVAVIGIVTLSSCSSCPCFGGKKKDAEVVAKTRVEHVVKPADNGKTIAVAVGDTIVFEATENPSTGYVWAAEYDKAILEAQESSFKSSATDPAIAGAPGVRTWPFTVKAAGKTDLALKNARSWAKDEAPAEAVKVTVEASAAK